MPHAMSKSYRKQDMLSRGFKVQQRKSASKTSFVTAKNASKKKNKKIQFFLKKGVDK